MVCWCRSFQEKGWGYTGEIVRNRLARAKSILGFRDGAPPSDPAAVLLFDQLKGLYDQGLGHAGVNADHANEARNSPPGRGTSAATSRRACSGSSAAPAARRPEPFPSWPPNSPRWSTTARP
ncbi:MAG: hypothetical protein R2882_15105 [Gemmatimonadales bacterium]